jgi:very-short-patch-repair endonuclease
MQFAIQHRSYIVKEYESGRSCASIGKSLNVNKNRILRALKYLGIKPRNHSEASKVALKTGKIKHPTQGRKRTIEERIKISSTQATNWEQLADFEKEKISKQAQERWGKIPDKKKEEIRSKANEAIRKAAKFGSKLENYIFNEITAAGYIAFQHRHITENANLECDILLPELRTVIEVDGPSHYYPIWGEETLKDNIKADLEKNGLLKLHGYVVLRVRTKAKSISLNTQRKVSEAVLQVLGEIVNGRQKEVIYLEI